MADQNRKQKANYLRAFGKIVEGREVVLDDPASEVGALLSLAADVLERSGSSKVHKTQLSYAQNGQYYWHALARNGRVLFDGGERLSHKKRLVEFCQNEWPHAPIDILDADDNLVETVPAVIA